MDRLEKALSEESRIRFTFAETTVAAKALEARHLSGPVASLALAEALTAAALLSGDAAEPDEAIMLRMSVDGPLQGLLVEATGAGGLRGFTNRKVLHDLDAASSLDVEAAWGASGSVQIVTSRPGTILNQTVLQVNPPLMRLVLARYTNQSLQIPTGSALYVHGDANGLITARGLMAQRMVDSDSDAFVRVLECFADDRVKQKLAAVSPHGGAAAFAEMFALPSITVRETRPLMFACRCSQEKSAAMLETLSREELETQINRGEAQDVTCHMCGKTYTMTLVDLQQILARKT